MPPMPVPVKQTITKTSPKVGFGGFKGFFFGLFFILFVIVPIIYAITLCFTSEGFNIVPGFLYIGNKLFSPTYELGVISQDILNNGFETYTLWEKILSCWGLLAAAWTLYFIISRLVMIFQQLQSDSKFNSLILALGTYFLLTTIYLLLTIIFIPDAIPEGISEGQYITGAFSGLYYFGKLIVMLVVLFQK